jgi:hypothetical protein
VVFSILLLNGKFSRCTQKEALGMGHVLGLMLEYVILKVDPSSKPSLLSRAQLELSGNSALEMPALSSKYESINGL